MLNILKKSLFVMFALLVVMLPIVSLCVDDKSVNANNTNLYTMDENGYPVDTDPFGDSNEFGVIVDSYYNDFRFIGSDLLSFELYRQNWQNAACYPVLFSTSISSSAGHISFTPYFRYIDVTNEEYLAYSSCDLYDSHSTKHTSFNFDVSQDRYVNRVFFAVSSDSVRHGDFFPVVISCDKRFTAQIIGVSMYVTVNNDYSSSEDYGDFSYLNVDYFDTDNHHFKFQFYVPVNFVFSSRVYYFSNPANFGNNSSYTAGYSTGYSDGYYLGQNKGYENGFATGNTVGYENGYYAGAGNANAYTFNSLLGAVFDVPVKVFTSMLNFEVFGVNMLNLATGIFTAALLIFVIRLILGGR